MKTTPVRFVWRGARTKQGWDRVWYAKTRPMQVIPFDKQSVWKRAAKFFGGFLREGYLRRE